MNWLQSFWWWVEIHTGTVRESGPYYGFWSGFGSDISEIGSVVGLAVIYYQHNNCHSKGCPWIARHEIEMDGVKYKVCRKCAGIDDNRPTREHFALHRAKKTTTDATSTST